MEYRIEIFPNSINSCIDVVRTKTKKSKQFLFLYEYKIGIYVIIYGSICLYILYNMYASLENVN